MSRPIRVLHIITRMNVGGAGGFVLDVCRLLTGKEFEFRVLSGPEPECEGSLEPLCRADGIELLRSPDLSRTPHPSRDRAAGRQIAAVIDDWRPDLVHTHTAKAGFLGRRMAHKRRVPAVHHVHGWSFPHQRPAVAAFCYRHMEARAARWCERLLTVCQSDTWLGLAAGIGRAEQYECVPAGIDVADVEAAARERDPALLEWKRDRPLIAFVGRLSRQKDPFTFVEAIHTLERRRPAACRYLLVGDGPLAREVEGRLAAGPAAAATRREGFRADVAAVLGAVDVLVHPSRHEGLPRMLLEGFAAGVPVVGTTVGGCEELLVDGVTSLNVPVEDPPVIADAVERLISHQDERHRIVAAARQLVTRYGIEACTERLAEVYHRVLGGRIS